ncbi:erythromycin esterase family protein [Oceanobacillus chungangensis]|uniref:Erythromycin esterase n=1 Tax=Oceanobacillus chungangensis TaxID=1229152 RepID=A0A3D8PWF3_9BACI|nr:erythromycin esterase family protein [Oceanobacillus chungangensis]RDW20480.1 erythromycin esterase [Oceanobacillus chungangensis]
MLNFPFINRKYNDYTNWVKDHSYGINDLATSKFEDFSFLEEVISEKRIVWLGENGHGIREHNLLKNKVVHYLYHKMGFKVIAFESGLTECYTSNYVKDELSAKQLLDKSIFSLWKTEETYPLFGLIKDNRELKLIGFDFQPSMKQSLLTDFLDKINIDFPQEFIINIQNVEEKTADWYDRMGKYKARRKRVPKDILQEYKLFQKEQNERIDRLHHILNDIKKYFINIALDMPYKFIKKALDNKRLFLNHFTDNDRVYSKFRDQVMAANLEWICNELYPNEKIIIWAHNAHIYKNYQSITKYRPMGSLISKALMDDSYYIGLFMYEGEAALINRTVYKIGKPPKKSLEDYMNHTDSVISFLDFSNVNPRSFNKWIFEKTLILEHGTMQKLITPAEQFDGIFFVKEVSPPHYI